MLVTIVAVPNADNTGLDPDRVEKVEDLHDDVARPMLDLGTARMPSDQELDAYRKTQADAEEEPTGDGPAGPSPASDAAQPAAKTGAPAVKPEPAPPTTSA